MQTSQIGIEGLSNPRRYAAIVAVSLGTVLASIDNGSVNIALPTLARDLHVEPSAVVLVVTIYQLMLIMTVLPLSALGDRIGHRVLYQYGQIAFIVATLSCFFVRSFPMLVLIRGIQALGAAATFSVNAALLRHIYPQSQLGRGLGLNTIIAASSASIAPTIGGLILSVAKWPWLFAASIPFGLLSLLIGWKALPDPHRRDHPYDVAAALMCAAMFGFAVLGLEIDVHGGSLILSAVLVTLAVGIGIVFVRREAGQVRPILPVDLLRQKRIALASTALLAAYIGTMTMMLTLPFRLQQGFGYSPAEAGLLLATWPAVMMVVAPTSGMLSDHVPAAWLGSIGMAIAFIGMTALAFLPSSAGHLDIIWRLALSGIGYGLFFSPNARQIMNAAPLERAAAAGGLTQTTRMAGQVLGSTIAAAMLAGGMGTGSAPPLAAAGLALFSGLCSLIVLSSAFRP